MQTTLDAQQIIKILDLQPHPEGGFFRETYRSLDIIPASAFPAIYKGQRACSTGIYYLLTHQTCSVLHKVASDELFHFYIGDPVEMINLFPDGSSSIIILGQDINNHQHLQHLVPRGVWQGACLVPGGRFALLGATVAPGFTFADYVEGNRLELLSSYPEHKDLITCLTHA